MIVGMSQQSLQDTNGLQFVEGCGHWTKYKGTKDLCYQCYYQKRKVAGIYARTNIKTAPICGHRTPRITRGYCDTCYQKVWHAENPDQAKAYDAAYRDAHRETLRKNWNRADAKRGRVAFYPKNLYKFNITKEEYKVLVESQNGLCAICTKPWCRRLCIDHNHQTGKVRGLLCGPCNAGIGMLQDSPIIMSNAIAYIQRTTEAIT